MGQQGSGSISCRSERCSPLHERSSPEILAVEVQQIEGKEHNPVRRLVDGRAQGIEVGDPVLVLDDDLAVNEGGVAWKLGCSFGHPRVRTCPVPAMPEKALTLPLSVMIRVR